MNFDLLNIPKIKDLVNSPSQKYQDIYNIIKTDTSEPLHNSSEYTLIDLLPKKEDDSEFMKNELKNFLKNQLHSNESTFKNVVR